MVKNQQDAPGFLEVAVTAALEVGRFQKRSLGKQHEIEYKGEINIVTEVDKKSEEMIIERIRQSYPQHDILAEESGAHPMASEYRWIIDPLDGTTNFAHGYPLWCVSIALERRGQIILGVIYEPNLDELFTAVRGKGATLNGKRLQVSESKNLKRSLLATGFAYNVTRAKRNNFDYFKKFILSARAVRRDGVAAVDLAYVAAGRFDGFWELGLWPWDIAAGIIMIEEAGGEVSHFDGSPVRVDSQEIVVSNGKIHQEMLTLLKGGKRKSQKVSSRS